MHRVRCCADHEAGTGAHQPGHRRARHENQPVSSLDRIARAARHRLRAVVLRAVWRSVVEIVGADLEGVADG